MLLAAFFGLARLFRGYYLRFFMSLFSSEERQRPNHALQRTRPSRCGCNPRPAGRVAELWSLGHIAPVKKEHEFVFIAVMDAEEKTVSHIHRLLRSAGIRFMAEGEGISELCVERADVERAVPLLQQER